MQKEYITVISSLLTGALGYALREWQNHSRPFVSLLGFTGDYIFSDLDIELNEEIIDPLNNSFYLNKLNILSSLEEIKDTRDNCYYIKEDSETIIKICDEIENFINKKNHSLLFQAIQKLFNMEMMNTYVLGLLLNGLIPFPKEGNIKKEAVFRLIESSINDGSYIISYTGKPFALGASFEKDNYYKDLFTPLSQVFSTANTDGIIMFIKSLKNNIRDELMISNIVLPKLEHIVNEYSHWGCEMYIGNLKKTPLLINNEATLFIEDKTGATFSEKCTLVINDFEQGEEIRKQYYSPLIIPSGDNLSFSFFTKNSQKSMNRGQDFRNAFNQGQAKGYLEISIRGVGLIKQRVFRTTKVLFSEINIA